MKNYLIIPARSGSKRIAHKNIRLFCGKPIISYPIIAGRESRLFDEIIVSTDSSEYADVAKKYGASRIFERSAKYANDHATSAEAVIEVIEQVTDLDSINVCMTYPTSAFLTLETLIESFDLFLESSCDALISIAEYPHPIQRCFVRNQNTIAYKNPESRNDRTQDLEKHYYDCGQFYWTKASTLVRNKSFVSASTQGYFLSDTKFQDLDNESDWKLAEFKYRYFIGK